MFLGVSVSRVRGVEPKQMDSPTDLGNTELHWLCDVHHTDDAEPVRAWLTRAARLQFENAAGPDADQ